LATAKRATKDDPRHIVETDAVEHTAHKAGELREVGSE
jgi:hypothetical protein